MGEIPSAGPEDPRVIQDQQGGGPPDDSGPERARIEG